MVKAASGHDVEAEIVELLLGRGDGGGSRPADSWTSRSGTRRREAMMKAVHDPPRGVAVEHCPPAPKKMGSLGPFPDVPIHGPGDTGASGMVNTLPPFAWGGGSAG